MRGTPSRYYMLAAAGLAALAILFFIHRDSPVHSSPDRPSLADFPELASTDNFYIQRLYERARDGDPDALNRLGITYQSGLSVERSDEKAAEMYRMAAALNYAKGQYNLGLLYLQGKGVPKNEDEAVKWFLKAAAQDLKPALNRMGEMYANGRGVERDDSKAFEMYLGAARQKDLSAMVNVAFRYHEGRGIEQDMAKTYAWLCVIETYKNYPAMRGKTAMLAAAKLDALSRMSPEQVRDAEKLAETYIDKYGRK